MSWQKMMGTGTKMIGEDDPGGWTVARDDGDYVKRHYDVLTEEGEIVKHCWPNAGFFNEVYTGGGDENFQDRKWKVTEIKARRSTDDYLSKAYKDG